MNQFFMLCNIPDYIISFVLHFFLSRTLITSLIEKSLNAFRSVCIKIFDKVDSFVDELQRTLKETKKMISMIKANSSDGKHMKNDAVSNYDSGFDIKIFRSLFVIALSGKSNLRRILKINPKKMYLGFYRYNALPLFSINTFRSFASPLLVQVPKKFRLPMKI